MRAQDSTRRLLDLVVGRQILSSLCQPLSSGTGYRELQRKVQGADYWHINKVAFDHWIQLLKKYNVIVHQRHSEGKKVTIQATEKSKLVFQHYEDILRIPDLDTISKEVRRNRVLILLNGLMPNYVNTSHLPWNMLKLNFPYLCYPPRDNVSYEAVEDALGMPLLDLLSQRPLESEGMVFPSDVSYDKNEIKSLSNALETFNNKDIMDTAVHKAIQSKEKICASVEDKLLCSYVQRMGLLLLAYKHWQEYDLISTLKRYDTLKQAFWNLEDWYLFIWYKSRFGTKHLSTFVGKLKIENIRKESDNIDEAFSKYKSNVRRLLKETRDGKKYQHTRRKYSLFINEMHNIVLPQVSYVKEKYRE